MVGIDSGGVQSDDGAAPVFLDCETRDLNRNGFIDAVRIEFTEAIDDSSLINALNFTFTGGVTAINHNDIAEGDTSANELIYITFTDNILTTGDTVDVSCSADTFTDMNGTGMLAISSESSADGASPVLTSATSTAEIFLDNLQAGSTIVLSFSEDISITPPLTASDFKVNTNGANPDTDFDGASLTATAGPGANQITIILTSATTSGLWNTSASLDFDTFNHVFDTSPANNPVADNDVFAEVPISGLIMQMILNILSRSTLDTDGNGFIDTIDIVLDRPVNDDFSDIAATVAGYTVTGIDTGINGALNDTISIHLSEASVPDTDAMPAVRITANTALMDSGGSFVLNPESTASIPSDLADPVVVNSLAAAGGNMVKVQFSEYVYSDAGASAAININGFDYVGNDFDSISAIDYKIDLGIKSAYFHVPNILTADNIMSGTFTVNAASVYDAEGNEMLSGSHAISALALNVIIPVFVQNETGTDPRLITVFDGTAGVFDTDLRLQASIQAAGETATASSLYFDADVGASFKANGIWLPGAVTGLLNSANTLARNYTDTGAGTALREYLIPGTDSEVISGSTLEFLFMLGAKYCLSAENPDRPDDMKLYSFKIQDLVDQGGGVTIMNNVMQPSNGDVVEVAYNLPRSGNVTITIFDLSGRVVDVLQRGFQEKGDGYRVYWDGMNRSDKIVASGIYFVKIVGPDIDQIRKVLILK